METKENNRKKICHITSAHPPEDGRIFRRACISSVQAGFKTYLVEKGESYSKQGVHIIGLGEPQKTDRLYRMTVFARRAYKEAKKINADLYHLHDPELLPYALKFKKQGKAVVFDSHEDYVEQIKTKEYLPKPIAKCLSKLFEMYAYRIYRKIDGYTYPGNEDGIITKQLCKRMVATDNLPWKSELYDRYDPYVEREDRTACYIGGLDAARGIEQIIDAAYKANCKLYLAGPFSSDEYRLKLENKEEYQCVEYLGIIGREEILNLLQKVQIGLCVLLDVGQYYKMTNLPTKVYEYMSMGIPVILNDSPYNKRIVNELGIGEAVNPNNTNEIATRICELIENSEKRIRFGENGRTAIATRYCWDKEQGKLISLYEAIFQNT